jgi:hypothetical protein
VCQFCSAEFGDKKKGQTHVTNAHGRQDPTRTSLVATSLETLHSLLDNADHPHLDPPLQPTQHLAEHPLGVAPTSGPVLVDINEGLITSQLPVVDPSTSPAASLVAASDNDSPPGTRRRRNQPHYFDSSSGDEDAEQDDPPWTPSPGTTSPPISPAPVTTHRTAAPSQPGPTAPSQPEPAAPSQPGSGASSPRQTTHAQPADCPPVPKLPAKTQKWIDLLPLNITRDRFLEVVADITEAARPVGQQGEKRTTSPAPHQNNAARAPYQHRTEGRRSNTRGGRRGRGGHRGRGRGQHHGGRQHPAPRNNYQADPEGAAHIQRLYRLNSKKAMRLIRGEASPYCTIPATDIESHFRECYSRRDGALGDHPAPDCMPPPQTRPPPLLQEITPELVKRALSKAKNTAPGPDRITYAAWRRLDPTLVGETWLGYHLFREKGG